MSLITQCPACATFFRVVPDQLRISDGWVRCGQCDEVFDANASVRSEAHVADAIPTSDPTAADAVDISATVQAGLGPQSGDSQPQSLADVPEPDAPAPMHVDVAVEEADRAEPDPFLSRSPKDLSDFSSVLVGADLHVDEPATEADAPDPDVPPERRYMQMFAPQTPQEADPKLSFMKPLRKPSRWSRPWVRAALGLTGVLLALVLLLQGVLHERDRLAAQYPQYRGELAALAGALGLELSPLKQIESVVIDSSAFTKVRAEVYKLSFTLRNTAGTPLATPSMELTLTDMQDQVLLRRVLSAKDFANLPTVLGSGAEQSAVLSVAVRSPVPLDRVAGYRLLAFYP